MLKYALTLVTVVAFSGVLQAQSFKFSIGYGVPWISQQVGTNSSTTYSTTLNPETNSSVQRTTNSTENVRGSFGAGINASAAFTYTLSENIGIELGISYLSGKEYSTSASYTDLQFDQLVALYREHETSKSRGILFTPALKFITQQRIFTPYFLVGPVFGKINFRRELERYREEGGAVSTEFRTTKFTGGVSIGLRGAVGVTVIVTKKVSLFSEIGFTGMNYYPKESEITRYVIDGENKIDNLTVNVRKTLFVDKVESDSQNTDDNTPNRSVRVPVAMSSMSANIG